MSRCGWSIGLCFLLSIALCHGQGRGALDQRGIEPSLAVEHFAVLEMNALVARGLAPSALPSAVIAFSSAPASLSLDPLGLAGAVLGVAIGDPLAITLYSPAFAVPPSGEVRWPFVAPPSVAGIWLHAQLAVLDGGPAGFVLSDGLAVAFGPARRASLVPTGSGPFQERVVFEDLSLSLPPPFARPEFTPLALTLTARPDPRAPSEQTAYVDAVPGFGDVIRWPNGLCLALGVEPDQRERFRVFAPGKVSQDFDLPPLFPPRVGREAWSRSVAASAFGPYAAVLAAVPVASAQGATLFLLRVDGENVPGTASPVLPISMTGPLAGLDIDEDSLTFLDGVLLVVDGDSARIARIPLVAPFTPELVPLPLVGGQSITELDGNLALARDGSAAILTGGASESFRDVLIVRASGPAVNLTLWPGEYQDASHGDLLDGDTLAIAPDASRIAFVRDLAGGRELFVQDAVPFGVRHHLTPNALFEDTIETLIGLYFYTGRALAFRAGQFADRTDVYKAEFLGGAPVLSNVTATSGFTAPPFDVGATLEPVATVGVSRGGLVAVTRPTIGTTELAVRFDGTGALPPLLLAGLQPGGFQSAPFTGRELAIVHDAQGSRLVDLAAPQAALATAPSGSHLGRILGRGQSLWIELVLPTGVRLARFDFSRGLVVIAGLDASALFAVAEMASGSASVTGLALGGTSRTWRIAANSAAAIVAPATDPIRVLP